MYNNLSLWLLLFFAIETMSLQILPPLITKNLTFPLAKVDFPVTIVTSNTSKIITISYEVDLGFWNDGEWYVGETLTSTQRLHVNEPVSIIWRSQNTENHTLIFTYKYVKSLSSYYSLYEQPKSPYQIISVTAFDEDNLRFDNVEIIVDVVCPNGTFYGIWEEQGSGWKLCDSNCPNHLICPTYSFTCPILRANYSLSEDFDKEATVCQHCLECPMESNILTGGACKLLEPCCLEGYVGTSCSECAKNYQNGGFSDICQPCRGTLIYFVLLLAAILVNAGLYRYLKDGVFPSVSIYSTYLQTFSLLGMMGIVWPDTVIPLLDSVKALTLHLPSISQALCINSDVRFDHVETQFVFSLGIKILILVWSFGSIIYGIFGRCINFVLHRGTPQSQRPFNLANEFKVFFKFINFWYMNLVMIDFDVLSCMISHETSSDSYCGPEDYWDPEMIGLLAADLTVVLFVYPGIVFLVSQHKKQAMECDPVHRTKFQNWILVFKSAVQAEHFRENMEKWNLTILLRKVLLLIPLSFFPGIKAWKSLIFMFIMILSLILQLTYKPYYSKRANKLEAVSLASSMILFTIGLLVSLDVVQSRESIALDVVKLALILTMAVICFSFSILFLRTLLHEWKDFRKTIQSKRLLRGVQTSNTQIQNSNQKNDTGSGPKGQDYISRDFDHDISMQPYIQTTAPAIPNLEENKASQEDFHNVDPKSYSSTGNLIISTEK